MAIQTAVAPGAVADDRGLLPARRVDLRQAVRLGLLGGVTAVFVSAVGMVEDFSGRDVLDELSLGTALLLAVPFVSGSVAGQPPAQLRAIRPACGGTRGRTRRDPHQTPQ